MFSFPSSFELNADSEHSNEQLRDGGSGGPSSVASDSSGLLRYWQRALTTPLKALFGLPEDPDDTGVLATTQSPVAITREAVGGDAVLVDTDVLVSTTPLRRDAIDGVNLRHRKVSPDDVISRETRDPPAEISHPNDPLGACVTVGSPHSDLGLGLNAEAAEFVVLGHGGGSHQSAGLSMSDASGRERGSAYRARSRVQNVVEDVNSRVEDSSESNRGWVSVEGPRVSRFPIPTEVTGLRSDVTIDDVTLKVLADHLIQHDWHDVIPARDNLVEADPRLADLIAPFAGRPTPLVRRSTPSATGDGSELAALLASGSQPVATKSDVSTASGFSGVDRFASAQPSVISVPSASPPDGGVSVPTAYEYGSRASASVYSSGFTASGGLILPTCVTRGNVHNFLARDAPGALGILSGSGEAFFSDFDLHVVLEKSRRKTQGDLGYHEQVEAMTKGLKSKLGISQWGVTRDEDKGNISASASAADTIHQTSEKVKELQKACTAWDYAAVFHTPIFKSDKLLGMSDSQLKSVHPDDVIDWDQDTQNIFTEVRGISYAQIKYWQRFLNLNHHVLPVDRDSNKYLFQYVANSLTPDLLKEVEKRFRQNFAVPERGGASFLWTTLITVYSCSRADGDALVQEMDEWKAHGPTKTKNQNLIKVHNRFKRIIPQLEWARRLDPSMISDAYKGLSKCSCPTFVSMFETERREYLKNEVLRGYALGVDPTVKLTQKQIATKLLDIFKSAEELYCMLCSNGEWTGAQGKELTYNLSEGGRSDFEATCWNCGGKHPLSRCPEKRNERTIAANRKAFWENRKKSVGEKKEIPTRDSSGTAKKEGPGANVTVQSTNCDRLTDSGKFEYKCMKCRSGKRAFKWGGHPTDYHDKWLANKDGFCMATAAPTHPVVLKQKAHDAQLLAARTSAGGATTSGLTAGDTAASGPRFTKAEFDDFVAKSNNLLNVIAQRPGTFEASQATTSLNALQASFARRQGF